MELVDSKYPIEPYFALNSIISILFAFFELERF